MRNWFGNLFIGKNCFEHLSNFRSLYNSEGNYVTAYCAICSSYFWSITYSCIFFYVWLALRPIRYASKHSFSPLWSFLCSSIRYVNLDFHLTYHSDELISFSNLDRGSIGAFFVSECIESKFYLCELFTPSVGWRLCYSKLQGEKV